MLWMSPLQDAVSLAGIVYQRYGDVLFLLYVMRNR